MPHARGDEPNDTIAQLRQELRMPHARGDEPAESGEHGQSNGVCPTHVGMNRVRDGVSGLATRMPHISDGLLSGR